MDLGVFAKICLSGTKKARKLNNTRRVHASAQMHVSIRTYAHLIQKLRRSPSFEGGEIYAVGEGVSRIVDFPAADAQNGQMKK